MIFSYHKSATVTKERWFEQLSATEEMIAGTSEKYVSRNLHGQINMVVPACSMKYGLTIFQQEMLRFEIELQDPIELGDGTSLHRKKPLLIKVEKTEDGFHSSAPAISFDDFVESYEELISTTNAMCALLWREYALADDSDLSEDARELKQRILDDFEVI